MVENSFKGSAWSQTEQNCPHNLPNILKIGLAGWDVIRFDLSQYNSVFPIKSLLDWFRNRLRSLPALSAVSFSLALITFK